jgi:hypothetical protein
MTEHEASRTLVKSPPELWAECSDAAALARHLGQFGEIRITRLEPETAVAWEGEDVSGTVRLEPSGWGTKVILTAQTPAPETPEPPPPEPEPDPLPPAAQEESIPEAEPWVVPEPEEPRRGWLSRWFRRRSAARVAAVPEPQPVVPVPELTPEAAPEAPEPPPEAPEPPPEASDTAGAALTAALDSLGQAHHRPFSRA